MPRHRSARRRPPRGGIDPITDPRTALDLFQLAAPPPMAWETIVVPVDQRYIGEGVIIVKHTTADTSLVPIVDCFARCADQGFPPRGLIVASFRPGGTVDDFDEVEWLDADDAAASHGSELIEWFVIGSGRVWLPRSMAGAESRWPADC